MSRRVSFSGSTTSASDAYDIQARKSLIKKKKEEKKEERRIKREKKYWIKFREAKAEEQRLREEKENSCSTCVGNFCESVCGWRFGMGGKRKTRKKRKSLRKKNQPRKRKLSRKFTKKKKN